MKKTLFLLLAAVVFLSCSRTSPSETAAQFVKASYLLDFETAAELASAGTRAVVSGEKLNIMDQNMDSRNRYFAENSFQLDSLKETVKGNRASVESGGIAISLIKEDGAWKVLASEKLMGEIVNRQEHTQALKAKWEQLKAAYESRMDAARQYAQFQSQAGSLTGEGQQLLELITNTSLAENFTAAQQQAYLKRQQEIGRLIEKVVVPSFTAGADLSLSFILRINEADKLIQQAKAEYNQLVGQHQVPGYQPVKE